MIELFILETCPYCRKVMDYFEKEGIKFLKRDVLNQKNYDLLMQLGGIDQVPFLYDEVNRIKLYDSENIISYLKQKYAQ